MVVGVNLAAPSCVDMATKSVKIVGLGAVGARVARQLASSNEVGTIGLWDVDAAKTRAVAHSLGTTAQIDPSATSLEVSPEVVVLATPVGTHLELAKSYLAQGVSVVSVSDSVEDVQGLLSLNSEAQERALSVVVGAGFSPGLSCVLAKHAAALFTQVEEIHVATTGTGGPACARQHHRALSAISIDWRDGAWQTRRGGSGRTLCWFPEPVGAKDCYRAARPEALLLAPAFPGLARATSRISATRRDRITAWLPMLYRPHPEGGPGGIRVEVHGRQDERTDVVVYGVMDRPAVAAGGVAAVSTLAVLNGKVTRTGAAGLAELVEPVPFLADLHHRGIKAAIFEGVAV